jgi:putative chitinase
MAQLKVIQDTYLKRTDRQQAAQLPEDQKQLVSAGNSFVLHSYAKPDNAHIKVSFKDVFFNGINTWYAYVGHVEITVDEKLRAYRDIALDRLAQLMQALPKEAQEADYFVDKNLRIYSGLPDRPENAPPYRGLYGTNASMDEYRNAAVGRLKQLILDLLKYEEVDIGIDAQIRKLSKLPAKPADADPYVRLFQLQTPIPDPVDPEPDAVITTGKEYVTTEQLLTIAGTRDLVDRFTALTPGVNATLERYNITTYLRMAHFIAQVMHESGGFRYLKELWGPTAAQSGYEGRSDLGNTQPGDGFRFRGRGLIQLTGRYNYRLFSNDIGVDFVSNPDLVAQPPYAVLAAGWYWDRNNINALADIDDVYAVTRRINGGLNGINDRIEYLNWAKITL